MTSKHTTSHTTSRRRGGRSAALLGVLAVALAVGTGHTHAACSAGPRNAAASHRSLGSLADRVRIANARSAEAYDEFQQAWREHLHSLRRPEKLRQFVNELLSLERKLQQGTDLLGGKVTTSDRVTDLFRRRVVDERTLTVDLERCLDAYQELLDAQDAELLKLAQVSRKEWDRMLVRPLRVRGAWGRALRPVIARAVQAAHWDVIRCLATTVASDYAGDMLKRGARRAGLDPTEKGSFLDWLTGLVADAFADQVIEKVTDPTAGIVEGLSKDLQRAERKLLDDETGLFAQLRRMKIAHEQARAQLLKAESAR